ncbi:MAG: metallophosphoesterase family protein [Chloroflexota bacterium]
MKIAIMSDIHGNSIALDAVLNDIDSLGGVDAYWFVGDYCAIGHDPVGVLERIANLPNAKFVRGNTDRYSVTNDVPHPYPENVLNNLNGILQLQQVARSFAWTRGMLTASGWFNWMRELPIEYRTTLLDGTRVLLVHAHPNSDDGDGLFADADDNFVNRLYGDADAELIFVGHIHWQHNRQLPHMRVVNVASVGNPVENRDACYTILNADTTGHAINFHEVHYDKQAVLDAIDASHHPTAEYVKHFYRGEFKLNPIWHDDFENKS